MNRRPLKIREHSIAKKIAKYLSKRKVTPNQISILSVFFAFLSGSCLVTFSNTPDPAAENIYLVFSAIFIQCRLLCNLFDGMVAIEGGKKTNSGELFNDIPDRIADPLILVAAGYAIDLVSLGWLTGLLSVMTAYVRILSAKTGAPQDFRGPMAKQHRMAIMTIACILAIFYKEFLSIALVIIAAGSIITVIRRAVCAYKYLENTNDK